MRNITYDITFNETYNITYNTRRRGVEFRHAVDARKTTPRRRTINVTEFVNVTKEVTTSYNITSQPVWKSKFYGTFASSPRNDFVKNYRVHTGPISRSTSFSRSTPHAQ